jgi:hypothetical protein
MPIIKIEAAEGLLVQLQEEKVGPLLEAALREAIKSIKPHAKPYAVVVKGGPFGPINHGQPDLWVEIEYKEEWGFSAAELRSLATSMQSCVQELLRRIAPPGTSSKVIVHALIGYASA